MFTSRKGIWISDSMSTNKEDINRERWLDCARTIAIVLVTFNHAVNRGFSSQPYEEYLLRPHMITWIHAVLNVMSRMGVPLFLMITGALLLKRDYTGKQVLKHFLQHNVLSLFITAELWYAIVFWYRVIFDRPDFIAGGASEIIKRFIMNQLFLNQYTLGNMWYMPMILVIYLILPAISLAIQKLPKEYIRGCCGFVILSSMLIPDLNKFLALQGIDLVLKFKPAETALFSIYMVYVITGYEISKGLFDRIRTGIMGILLGVSTICLFSYQYWGYAHPEPYAVYYSSFGLLIVSAFLFDMIRRIQINDAWNRVFRYLSGRALAIYFVHMPIMVGIKSVYLKNSVMHEILQFLLLETVSVMSALLIIAVLERNS